MTIVNLMQTPVVKNKAVSKDMNTFDGSNRVGDGLDSKEASKMYISFKTCFIIIYTLMI